MSSIYNGGCGAGGTTNISYNVQVSGSLPQDQVFQDWTFTNIGTSGVGLYASTSAHEAKFYKIEGGENVAVSLSGDVVRIDVAISALEGITAASASTLIESYGYITQASADLAYLSAGTPIGGFTEASADAKYLTPGSADAAYLSANAVVGITETSVQAIVEGYGYITQASADLAYLSAGTPIPDITGLISEASADAAYLSSGTVLFSEGSAISRVESYGFITESSADAAYLSSGTVLFTEASANNLFFSKVAGVSAVEVDLNINWAVSTFSITGNTLGDNIISYDGASLPKNVFIGADDGSNQIELNGVNTITNNALTGATINFFHNGIPTFAIPTSAPVSGYILISKSTDGTTEWVDAKTQLGYITESSADSKYMSANRVLFSEGSADAKYLTPGSADTAYLSSGVVLFTEASADEKYLTEGSALAAFLSQSLADVLYLSAATVLFSEASADAKYLTEGSANNLYLTEGSADNRYILQGSGTGTLDSYVTIASTSFISASANSISFYDSVGKTNVMGRLIALASSAAIEPFPLDEDIMTRKRTEALYQKRSTVITVSGATTVSAGMAGYDIYMAASANIEFVATGWVAGDYVNIIAEVSGGLITGSGVTINAVTSAITFDSAYTGIQIRFKDATNAVAIGRL